MYIWRLGLKMSFLTYIWVAYTLDGVAYYSWRWTLFRLGRLFGVEGRRITNHVILSEPLRVIAFHQLVKVNHRKEFLRNEE
jgi:hypothetical protein